MGGTDQSPARLRAVALSGATLQAAPLFIALGEILKSSNYALPTSWRLRVARSSASAVLAES